MEGDFELETIRRTGQWDERWRFKREDSSSIAPRESALAEADVFADVSTVLPELRDSYSEQEAVLDKSFP